jgi:hypothetical protein
MEFCVSVVLFSAVPPSAADAVDSFMCQRTAAGRTEYYIFIVCILLHVSTQYYLTISTISKINKPILVY